MVSARKLGEARSILAERGKASLEIFGRPDGALHPSHRLVGGSNPLVYGDMDELLGGCVGHCRTLREFFRDRHGRRFERVLGDR